MTYYQMDDGFDTDARVLRAGTAAFGLYARCGIWAARTHSDGFVSAELASSYGTREWIEKLVATGLWVVVDGGFVMPDYLGIHGNKTAEKIQELRKAAAARQEKARAKRYGNASRSESRVTHTGSHGVSHTALSSPSLKGEGGGASLREGAAPPPARTLVGGRVICATHHLELVNGACRGCAADAIAADDEPTTEPPPPPAEVEPQPRASPAHRALAAARGEPPTAGPVAPVERDPDHDAAVRTLSAVPPDDIDGLLAAAARQLAAAGQWNPSERELTVLAADLATRPATNGGT